MSESYLRINYAQLQFYVREKYWHHAEELCAVVVTTADDWLFRVWRAFCLDQQGLVNDALREYKAAESRRQTVLPAVMGMFLIYKRNRDQDGMNKMELILNDDAHANNVDGWVQAAALCWAAGDVNAARDILLRFPSSEQEHRDEYTNLATIRAWVDLSTGRGALLEKCGTLFQSVLDAEMQHDGLDINAALGRVAFLERKYQYLPAQDLLNKLIVAYPSFNPVLVVKARLLMRAEDWEQAIDTTRRILAKEKDNIEAITLEALHALVKDARFGAAASYLNTLVEAMRTREPRNAPLYYQLAQAFSRLSRDHLPLLGLTTQLAEQACSLDSRNGEYLCEVGYQQLYRGDHKQAITTFKKASTLTDSMSPLLGTIIAHIKLGKLDDASSQVAFCNELQAVNQRNAELSMLNAVVLWRTKKDEAGSLLCLDQAAEAMRQSLARQSGNGLELYVTLNEPVMLTIAREYMLHCRNEPPDPSLRQPDVIAEKCRRHVELLTRHVPGCAEAQMLLAKIHFVSGDLNKAQSVMKQCLRQESPLPEAFLLSAQICQYVGNVKLANQALEQALTLDFEIKDQPFYNLLQGVVLGMMNRSQQALESLELAQKILATPDHVTSKGRPIEPLSVPDHVTLYLQLAQTHLRLHDADEARKILTEAANTFRATTQAGRVAIAQAMLTARTDVDKAIETLRQVPPNSDFFIPARKQMATLFLVQRQNPAKYAECFEDMVKEAPSVQSYVQLGEAYSNVQEPEKAIAAYEKAKAMSPGNSDLAVRIGRALVATHDYEKAVRYYTDALTADEHLFAVRADLAMLLWHLGHTAKALRTLQQAPVYQRAPGADPDEDVAVSIERVNCALLLYKVHRGLLDPARDGAAGAAGGGGSSVVTIGRGGDGGSAAGAGTTVGAGGTTDLEAIKALLQARSFQQFIVENKLRNETRETMVQQKSILTGINTELARCYAKLNDVTKAKELLEEGLKYDESNETAMLELAALHLRVGDLDGCEGQCNAVMKMNPGCEQAVVLLADVMLHRRQFDEAATLFEELLDKTRNNYIALAQYIQLLRNAGRLQDAEKVLEKAASKVGVGHRPDPGLSYARGLYYRYTNANAEALRAFNQARVPTDNPWSERALVRMIEVYLVPTTVELWVDNVATAAAEDKSDNLRCAEQLLLQLSMGEDRQLLQAYCLVATKRKVDLEKAMHIFLQIIDQAQRRAKMTASAARDAAGEGGNGNKKGDAMKGGGGAAAASSAVGGGEAGAATMTSSTKRSEDTDDEDDALLRDVGKAAAAIVSAAAGAASNPTLAAALECEHVHLPAFLGLSITLYLLDQETVARNVLARIFAAPPSPGQEDTIERARLLEAHMDIKTGRLDAAHAVLQKVLEHNQSCASAWDSQGTLYERQQKHKEASHCYESAWKLGKESDPAVGYKLAFNYLKGSDPVKAIDVSKQVLAHHASYPRLEEEVVDVAYFMLRP